MTSQIERENSRRRSAEARERGVESEKTKEGEVDAELKQAALMERADFLLKEVKTSQKQMQNILLNIQQVLNLIRQLREQLRLAGNPNEPSSVIQDRQKVEELKKKIAGYSIELEKMRGDLAREQMEELRKLNNNLSDTELKKKAEEMVEEMIKGIS